MYIFNCCGCGERGSGTFSTPTGDESPPRKPSGEVVDNVDVAAVTKQPTVYRAVVAETVVETETVTEVATPIILTRTQALSTFSSTSDIEDVFVNGDIQRTGNEKY